MKKIMLLLICCISVASAQPAEANIQSKIKGIAAAVGVLGALGGIGVVSVKSVWAMKELVESDLSFYTRATGAIGLFIAGMIGSTVIGEVGSRLRVIACEEFSK